MILFYDIFEKAITMFDDPDIRHDYVFNKSAFCGRMREYLLNGLRLFVSPTIIVDQLVYYSDPVYGSEEITEEAGDTFVLTASIPENSVFTYKVNGQLVKGTYNPETNSVTLIDAITADDTLVVEWCFAGAFTADFSDILRKDISSDAIMGQILTILAQGIVCMWDEEEMNRALENRNILSDSDFKLHSPANSVNAKIAHHKQVLAEMDTLLSQLEWRILSTPRGGSRFGK